MPATAARHDKEEFARLGDAIYDRDLRSLVEPGRNGEFAAIDIETGAFEVDADELAAAERLAARIPGAQTWLRKIGSTHTRRIGPRPGVIRP